MDTQELTNHHMMIRNRKTMDITGITKIDSLNNNSFILETVLGNMTIKGEDLEMTSLDIDKGELSIKGYVKAIEYSDYQSIQQDKEGFLTKLFK